MATHGDVPAGVMQKLDARIIIAGAHPKGPIDLLIILSSWIEVHIVVVLL